jgi:hypothetical protein
MNDTSVMVTVLSNEEIYWLGINDALPLEVEE